MNTREIDSEAQPRRMVGRASIVAGGTAYQQGITFVTGLLIARVIGAADFGIYNLARRLLDVVVILTRMGLDIGLQRHFGEVRAGDDPQVARFVVRRVRMMASGLALLPVALVLFGVGRYLEDNVYQYSGFANVLLVLALALPFWTDISVLGGAYRGSLKLAPSVLAECVAMPTLRLLAIVALFLFGWRLWAVVVGTTLAAFLTSSMLALRASKDFATVGDDRRYPWSDATNVIGYSGILACGVVVGTLTSTMDVLVLGRYVDADTLGQYSLAKTLMLLMGAFGIAFSQGLGALVAERYRRGDIDDLVRVMSLTARWIALGTLPVFAIFLFWGSRLTLLFGESFAIAQSVVAWLSVGQFIFSVLGPAGWALSMTGKQFLEFRILATGLATAVLLCTLAVPVYGQLGAAVATCCSIGVAHFLRLYFVRRHIGRFPFGTDIIVITATGVGAAALCDLAVASLHLAPLSAALVRILSFLAAYAALAWFVLLRDDEKHGLRRALGNTVQLLFYRAV